MKPCFHSTQHAKYKQVFHTVCLWCNWRKIHSTLNVKLSDALRIFKTCSRLNDIAKFTGKLAQAISIYLPNKACSIQHGTSEKSMKERNIVTNLWPKYKQTGAEEYYLEEKQRLKEQGDENENSLPRKLKIPSMHERQIIKTKNIEGSYRWEH